SRYSGSPGSMSARRHWRRMNSARSGSPWSSSQSASTSRGASASRSSLQARSRATTSGRFTRGARPFAMWPASWSGLLLDRPEQPPGFLQAPLEDGEDLAGLPLDGHAPRPGQAAPRQVDEPLDVVDEVLQERPVEGLPPELAQ